MQQIWISKAGPPEVPELRAAPDPSPREGEVRIRVRAAGNVSSFHLRLVPWLCGRRLRLLPPRPAPRAPRRTWWRWRM